MLNACALRLVEANRINARELTCALQALGFEPRRGEVTELVTRHSSTGDGTIDVDTFERIITDKLNESEPVELLAHAFALFDEDGDGFITAADIERIAKDLGGDELEPSEISLMIAEAALADTERVSLDDFLRVMRRT